jgi:hypothetical protein
MRAVEKPAWVRRINYLGDTVGGARYMVDLDPDALIELAMNSVGLSDFGDDAWKPAYYNWLGALAQSDFLHLLGRLRTRSDVLRVLRNKLLATEKIKRQPAICAETIRAPLVIVGSPRSGTSILFELLAQDARWRAPLTWEAAFPVSPLCSPTYAKLSRGELAQGVSDLLMDMQPDMRSIHEFRWDLPVECYQIMEISCVNLRCINAVSIENRYLWHKRVLQLLQHESEQKNWLLKCNFHLGNLEQLLATYPDARIINTHRDPAKSIPSLMSLQRSFNAALTDQIPPANLDALLDRFAGNFGKVIEQRRSGVIPHRQIIDVKFSDLMKDPLAAIKAAYDHFELEFDTTLGEKMLRYLAQRPRQQHAHRYGFAADSVENIQIRERLRFYTDHYAIALES